MQYYSKSPHEMKEHFEAYRKRERKKNLTSKIFFFLNLAIILIVFAVFQYRTRQDALARKEFRWAQYAMESHCGAVGCTLIIKDNPDGLDTGLTPAKLSFQLRLPNEKEAAASALLPLNPHITGEYRYQAPIELTERHTVFVLVLNASDQEIVSFRIYP